MKKQLPKTCLTCKFMEFVDDELEELHCFNPNDPKNAVQDDYVCDLYELNKLVEDDAKAGCW